MKNIIDLTGKHILVVGASNGIGKAVALRLASVGAILTLVARDQSRLTQTISEMDGTNHKAFSFDASKTLKIEEFLKHLREERGSLDGFVYCVGIGPNRPLKVCKPDYMEEVMRTNFFGFFEFCRNITKKNFHNQGLHIVGISSCASVMGGKGQSAYSASKSAMDASVRILAQELADKGICINTVRPGMIDTGTYRAVLETCSEKEVEALNAQQFLGVGMPDDIANLIAYLLSPASNFITGTSISADGGYTCH